MHFPAYAKYLMRPSLLVERSGSGEERFRNQPAFFTPCPGMTIFRPTKPTTLSWTLTWRNQSGWHHQDPHSRLVDHQEGQESSLLSIPTKLFATERIKNYWVFFVVVLFSVFLWEEQDIDHFLQRYEPKLLNSDDGESLQISWFYYQPGWKTVQEYLREEWAALAMLLSKFCWTSSFSFTTRAREGALCNTRVHTWHEVRLPFSCYTAGNMVDIKFSYPPPVWYTAIKTLKIAKGRRRR